MTIESGLLAMDPLPEESTTTMLHEHNEPEIYLQKLM